MEVGMGVISQLLSRMAPEARVIAQSMREWGIITITGPNSTTPPKKSKPNVVEHYHIAHIYAADSPIN
jgi:hypothetical protein